VAREFSKEEAMIKNTIAVVLVTLALAYTINEYLACSRVGGTLVRGLFSFECVE